MVGARLRAKAGVSAATAPEMSDASTQTEPLRKEIAVQASRCDECPDLPPEAQARTCERCKQVEDLSHQVAELQETVRRLRSVRGAEEEIDEWFHNQSVVVDATQNKAPWTLVTHKSRTALHFPPSCITTRYNVLTPEDTDEQALQGETVPAAHTRNHKKKR